MMNAWMEKAFEVVIQMSASASVLIIGIWLLRRWLPLTVLYIIGILIVCRLVIPIVPASDYSLMEWGPKLGEWLRGEPAVSATAEVASLTEVALRAPDEEIIEVGLWRWQSLALVWAGGCLVFGGCQLVHWLRFRAWLRVQPRLDDRRCQDLFEACQKRVGIRRRVTLLSVDRMQVPAVYGFLRPRVLIPERFVSQLDSDTLRHIFLHELSHVRRHDVALGALVSGVALLHWFNPLVWLAGRRFTLIRELLCDRAVLQLMSSSPDAATAYGETLIRMASTFIKSRPVSPGLVQFLSEKDEIKQRLTMIVKPTTKHWLRTVAGLMVIAGLAVASMTLVALPTPSDDGEGERREKRERAAKEFADRDREHEEEREHRNRRERRETRDHDDSFRDSDDEKKERRTSDFSDRRREARDHSDDEARDDRGGRREFQLERIQSKIKELLSLGRREEARKLSTELERRLADRHRDRLNAEREERLEHREDQDKRAESLADENRKLRGHLNELSASVRAMHEKMEKLQRQLDRLVEDR